MTEDLRLAAEQLARAQIDKQLTLAGWADVDRKALNPFAPSAVPGSAHEAGSRLG